MLDVEKQDELFALEVRERDRDKELPWWLSLTLCRIKTWHPRRRLTSLECPKQQGEFYWLFAKPNQRKRES